MVQILEPCLRSCVLIFHMDWPSGMRKIAKKNHIPGIYLALNIILQISESSIKHTYDQVKVME